MKKLKYLLFSIIPVLLFTSKVNAVSIEMYQDQQMSALGYKECILAQCWDRYRNVKYDGQLASLNFYSPLTISPLEKYTLTINFRGDDFISAKANTVSVNNNTECSIISTQTDGNEYSTYLKIAFVCGQSSDWFHVNVGGAGDEDYITGVINYGITTLDIVNETAKDTEKIIAGNDKNTDNIINNNDKNTNTIIDKNKENTDKILDSNKDTQNVIKDQFNTCRDSVNLFDKSKITSGWIRYSDNAIMTDSSGRFYYSDYIEVSPNTIYTLNLAKKDGLNNGGIMEYDSSKNWLNIGTAETEQIFTFTTSSNTKYIRFTIRFDSKDKVMLEKGSSASSYEQFGQICSNKLDEQTKTSKNIWETIKSFPSTFSKFFTDLGDKIGKFFDNLLTGIINGLKSLFIPSDDFFSNWWNDFKSFMEAKLGFLSKPIDIFITFISSYLNLSDTNIVINIPNITVPNFEDHIIIKAQTFNWKQLLESKPSFKTLWELYLDFIDVYLIFNFIGLCDVVYARIFGGDTNIYEYYTVEDSYYYDSESGEVQGSPKHSERKTTRRKKE